MDYTKLKGRIPDTVLQQIPQTFTLGVDGPKRLSNLLGQCKHESMNFSRTVENLSYSGEALWGLFHKYFTDRNEAESFAHQPERIANRIYANRMGNGDESSDDGWKYRGHGYLQITGKNNTQAFFTSIGLDPDTDPSLISLTYPLTSAAWFFKENDIWQLCDKGVDMATVTIVTRHVNPGLLGLDKRLQYTQEFYNILTNTSA